LPAAAPVGANLVGRGAGAPARAAAEAGRAPAAEALAGKKPSKFSLLLASLLRGGRAGSGSGARPQGPVTGQEGHGPGGRAPAARTGQARRRASVQADAVPARLQSEVRRETAKTDGQEPRLGRVAARRLSRRKQPPKPEAFSLEAEKRLPAARSSALAPRAEATTGAGRRADGLAGVRGSSGPRVFVVDLRRPARPSRGAGPAEAQDEAASRRPASAEPAEREPAGEKAGALKGTGFERQLARAVREAPPQESQPPLLRALQQRVIPQIVQRTGIILRDGGEGEIRLVLKPEHLGAVRVRLHLGESSLEGRIVVDNNIVKELLEANLEHLRNALRQEGFASPNIEVSVGGGRGEGRAPSDGEPGDEAPAAVAARRAREFEASAPLAWEAGLGYSTVNIWI